MGADPLVLRIHRIDGQVRALERMLGEGRPCDEVLVQISAARGALAALAREVLREEASREGADAAALLLSLDSVLGRS